MSMAMGSIKKEVEFPGVFKKELRGIRLFGDHDAILLSGAKPYKPAVMK